MTLLVFFYSVHPWLPKCGLLPPTSPLQSAAITSVIVEPFNRVALGTPNPPRHVEEGGRGGRLIAEEEQICLSGGSLPIKRKIRLEMGTLRKEVSYH